MKPNKPKCIINRDVFDETRMTIVFKDQQQANNQESDYDNTQVEVELPVHQENELEFKQKKDKAKREIVPLKRFGQVDLIYYALNVDSKESENWLEVIIEEMHSLEKNKTWILVYI
ncbi:hypothetical protein CR513_18451, partial [Mucuna pruriens]